MTISLFHILVVNEARLRLRRLSSLVTVAAVTILTWLSISDPQSGTTLMAIDGAHVLYTSSALALGSSLSASLLFGLAGFYLVRGRIAEDLRSGTGVVIAATPVSNLMFLLGRWLGGVLYLLTLAVFFMITVLVCHLLRGHGPIEPGIYLQTYAAQLLPLIFFVVSCAILSDSFSPLMGKFGDVIFFFIWAMQVSLISHGEDIAGANIQPFMLFDFIGSTMPMVNLKMLTDSHSVAIGFAGFNQKLPGMLLPSLVWPAEMIALRMKTALLALLPILPAIVLFHRFSPDHVKIKQAVKRRSPLAYLNQLLQPLSRLAQPLFRIALSLPGLAGQLLGELALTVTTTPVAAIALLALPLLSLLMPYRTLPGQLLFSVAVWGMLISEISCRDHQAATTEMTGAVSGGVAQRYLRQFAASVILGVLLMGTIAARWFIQEPLLACALISGILSTSALASLLGRATGTSRAFLALFLFGLYVAVNGTKIPMIDVFGFNGAANMHSILTQCLLAGTLFASGYLYNRRFL